MEIPWFLQLKYTSDPTLYQQTATALNAQAQAAARAKYISQLDVFYDLQKQASFYTPQALANVTFGDASKTKSQLESEAQAQYAQNVAAWNINPNTAGIPYMGPSAATIQMARETTTPTYEYLHYGMSPSEYAAYQAANPPRAPFVANVPTEWQASQIAIANKYAADYKKTTGETITPDYSKITGLEKYNSAQIAAMASKYAEETGVNPIEYGKQIATGLTPIWTETITDKDGNVIQSIPHYEPVQLQVYPTKEGVPYYSGTTKADIIVKSSATGITKAFNYDKDINGVPIVDKNGNYVLKPVTPSYAFQRSEGKWDQGTNVILDNGIRGTLYTNAGKYGGWELVTPTGEIQASGSSLKSLPGYTEINAPFYAVASPGKLISQGITSLHEKTLSEYIADGVQTVYHPSAQSVEQAAQQEWLAAQKAPAAAAAAATALTGTAYGATRPGYYATYGDRNTPSLVNTLIQKTPGLSEYSATGQALNQQRNVAIQAGDNRGASFFTNELEKWAEVPIEQAAGYHAEAMISGKAYIKNPFEEVAANALDFLKGQPTKPSEIMSPYTGETAGILPNIPGTPSAGLQQTAWQSALGVLPLAQQPSYEAAVKALGAAEATAVGLPSGLATILAPTKVTPGGYGVTRPGYYALNTLGTPEIQDNAQHLIRTLGLTQYQAVGQALSDARDYAISSGNIRLANQITNDLQKWGEIPIEQAAGYHAEAMASGKVYIKNPFEEVSANALDLLKGQPTKPSERMSQYTGETAGLLPSIPGFPSAGLQQTAWQSALGILPVTKQPSYEAAVKALGAAEATAAGLPSGLASLFAPQKAAVPTPTTPVSGKEPIDTWTGKYLGIVQPNGTPLFQLKPGTPEYRIAYDEFGYQLASGKGFQYINNATGVSPNPKMGNGQYEYVGEYQKPDGTIVSRWINYLVGSYFDIGNEGIMTGKKPSIIEGGSPGAIANIQLPSTRGLEYQISQIPAAVSSIVSKTAGIAATPGTPASNVTLPADKWTGTFIQKSETPLYQLTPGTPAYRIAYDEFGYQLVPGSSGFRYVNNATGIVPNSKMGNGQYVYVGEYKRPDGVVVSRYINSAVGSYFDVGLEGIMTTKTPAIIQGGSPGAIAATQLPPGFVLGLTGVPATTIPSGLSTLFGKAIGAGIGLEQAVVGGIAAIPKIGAQELSAAETIFGQIKPPTFTPVVIPAAPSTFIKQAAMPGVLQAAAIKSFWEVPSTLVSGARAVLPTGLNLWDNRTPAQIAADAAARAQVESKITGLKTAAAIESKLPLGGIIPIVTPITSILGTIGGIKKGILYGTPLQDAQNQYTKLAPQIKTIQNSFDPLAKTGAISVTKDSDGNITDIKQLREFTPEESINYVLVSKNYNDTINRYNSAVTTLQSAQAQASKESVFAGIQPYVTAAEKTIQTGYSKDQAYSDALKRYQQAQGPVAKYEVALESVLPIIGLNVLSTIGADKGIQGWEQRLESGVYATPEQAVAATQGKGLVARLGGGVSGLFGAGQAATGKGAYGVTGLTIGGLLEAGPETAAVIPLGATSLLGQILPAAEFAIRQPVAAAQMAPVIAGEAITQQVTQLEEAPLKAGIPTAFGLAAMSPEATDVFLKSITPLKINVPGVPTGGEYVGLRGGRIGESIGGTYRSLFGVEFPKASIPESELTIGQKVARLGEPVTKPVTTRGIGYTFDINPYRTLFNELPVKGTWTDVKQIAYMAARPEESTWLNPKWTSVELKPAVRESVIDPETGLMTEREITPAVKALTKYQSPEINWLRPSALVQPSTRLGINVTEGFGAGVREINPIKALDQANWWLAEKSPVWFGAGAPVELSQFIERPSYVPTAEDAFIGATLMKEKFKRGAKFEVNVLKPLYDTALAKATAEGRTFTSPTPDAQQKSLQQFTTLLDELNRAAKGFKPDRINDPYIEIKKLSGGLIPKNREGEFLNNIIETDRNAYLTGSLAMAMQSYYKRIDIPEIDIITDKFEDMAKKQASFYAKYYGKDAVKIVIKDDISEVWVKQIKKIDPVTNQPEFGNKWIKRVDIHSQKYGLGWEEYGVTHSYKDVIEINGVKMAPLDALVARKFSTIMAYAPSDITGELILGFKEGKAKNIADSVAALESMSAKAQERPLATFKVSSPLLEEHAQNVQQAALNQTNAALDKLNSIAETEDISSIDPHVEIIQVASDALPKSFETQFIDSINRVDPDAYITNAAAIALQSTDKDIPVSEIDLISDEHQALAKTQSKLYVSAYGKKNVKVVLKNSFSEIWVKDITSGKWIKRVDISNQKIGSQWNIKDLNYTDKNVTEINGVKVKPLNTLVTRQLYHIVEDTPSNIVDVLTTQAESGQWDNIKNIEQVIGKKATETEPSVPFYLNPTTYMEKVRLERSKELVSSMASEKSELPAAGKKEAFERRYREVEEGKQYQPSYLDEFQFDFAQGDYRKSIVPTVFTGGVTKYVEKGTGRLGRLATTAEKVVFGLPLAASPLQINYGDVTKGAPWDLEKTAMPESRLFGGKLRERSTVRGFQVSLVNPIKNVGAYLHENFGIGGVEAEPAFIGEIPLVTRVSKYKMEGITPIGLGGVEAMPGAVRDLMTRKHPTITETIKGVEKAKVLPPRPATIVQGLGSQESWSFLGTSNKGLHFAEGSYIPEFGGVEGAAREILTGASGTKAQIELRNIATKYGIDLKSPTLMNDIAELKPKQASEILTAMDNAGGEPFIGYAPLGGGLSMEERGRIVADQTRILSPILSKYVKIAADKAQTELETAATKYGIDLKSPTLMNDIAGLNPKQMDEILTLMNRTNVSKYLEAGKAVIRRSIKTEPSVYRDFSQVLTRVDSIPKGAEKEFTDIIKKYKLRAQGQITNIAFDKYGLTTTGDADLAATSRVINGKLYSAQEVADMASAEIIGLYKKYAKVGKVMDQDGNLVDAPHFTSNTGKTYIIKRYVDQPLALDKTVELTDVTIDPLTGKPKPAVPGTATDKAFSVHDMSFGEDLVWGLKSGTNPARPPEYIVDGIVVQSPAEQMMNTISTDMYLSLDEKGNVYIGAKPVKSPRFGKTVADVVGFLESQNRQLAESGAIGAKDEIAINKALIQDMVTYAMDQNHPTVQIFKKGVPTSEGKVFGDVLEAYAKRQKKYVQPGEVHPLAATKVKIPGTTRTLTVGQKLAEFLATYQKPIVVGAAAAILAPTVVPQAITALQSWYGQDQSKRQRGTAASQIIGVGAGVAIGAVEVKGGREGEVTPENILDAVRVSDKDYPTTIRSSATNDLYGGLANYGRSRGISSMVDLLGGQYPQTEDIVKPITGYPRVKAPSYSEKYPASATAYITNANYVKTPAYAETARVYQPTDLYAKTIDYTKPTKYSPIPYADIIKYPEFTGYPEITPLGYPEITPPAGYPKQMPEISYPKFDITIGPPYEPYPPEKPPYLPYKIVPRVTEYPTTTIIPVTTYIPILKKKKKIKPDEYARKRKQVIPSHWEYFPGAEPEDVTAFIFGSAEPTTKKSKKGKKKTGEGNLTDLLSSGQFAVNWRK
jgi:hypothetical protein